MSITYTYESNTMYLYTLKVHCTIGITKLEHSCEIDEVFTLFPFTLQYWMSINYTYEGNMMSVHIKSSPYYRYNLSRTHFARLIWNLCTVHFHSTVLYVYYLHLWKQYDVFVHIKSSLYYRYNWSRTQL